MSLLSAADRPRWLSSWPEVGGAQPGLAWSAGDAEWKSVVVAAYKRFPDHWAAGVAYHL